MDEKLLEKIIQDYQNELKELEENRRRRSEMYSQMTEDEFVEAYVKELKEIKEFAIKEGIPILEIPSDEEGGEPRIVNPKNGDD